MNRNEGLPDWKNHWLIWAHPYLHKSQIVKGDKGSFVYVRRKFMNGFDVIVKLV